MDGRGQRLMLAVSVGALVAVVTGSVMAPELLTAPVERGHGSPHTADEHSGRETER